MSYALETKKRKFHRVLESLTKPSNSDSKPITIPTSTLPVDHTPSAKRARLNGRDDSILASVRKDILKIARPTSQASSVSSQSRPTFVPWDRDRFLERLETFRRVDRWSPKPSGVNEVEWAKRGWICTDVARVTCVGGCGGSVVVKIPDELDELDGYDSEKIQERKAVRTKLEQEYARLIVQGHGENCPWRNKGCDDTIHRLQLTNPDTAISVFRTRYSRLLKIAEQLPDPASLQTPEGFDAQYIMCILPDTPLRAEPAETQRTGSENGQEGEPLPTVQSHPINEVAFVLAFFGWNTIDGSPGLAACSACFRRLGLWIYKSKDKGETSSHDSLDVANEHMEYCPWINGNAQSGTGKPSEKKDTLQSGWEALVQAVKVKHIRQTRSSTPIGSRAGSEAPSMDGSLFGEDNDDVKKAKDREWWAKIRRMRQVLNVNSPKRKPSTAR
ncbi:C3HC zinc finger-like-domain-containing protein [Aspergillus pseudoustus]|uniref:C3HC zinc finger-like-domain-containing protein n=1 Tax=Aspergillus pseudoustus TaxID=1810923 RepID=A0ABR4L0I3_9EURO